MARNILSIDLEQFEKLLDRALDEELRAYPDLFGGRSTREVAVSIRKRIVAAYEQMPKCYIYALRDPDTDEIRYVGRSIDPETRFVSHYYEAMSMDRLYEVHVSAKNRWFRSLVIAGKEPRLEVLEEVPRAEAWQRERAWYERALEEGHRLTNIVRPS